LSYGTNLYCLNSIYVTKRNVKNFF